MSVGCHVCGGPVEKMIFAGLPGTLCEDEACSGIDGPAAAIAIVMAPFMTDGWLFAVYEGSYWLALWEWLFGSND